ncbi:MAG: Murein DD-endopeptidase MepM and murein hydrolase activator NlpD, containing LysM domain [Firmicutes bacterium]|nr:Murein DD-endopeptidase MepM and murein hydrolase activator NlpD, containing LysM domain [Bacillota bacterium]
MRTFANLIRRQLPASERRIESMPVSPRSRRMTVARRIVCWLLMLSFVFGTWVMTPPCAVAAASTKEELAAAVAKQAAIGKKLDQLEKQREILNNKQQDLSGDLAWLKTRSQQQQELFQQKSDQLQAALEELNQAYQEYLAAEDRLTAKRAQYVQRMQIMYEHQQHSLLEIFLESGSVQGFFTTLQIMSIVEDADQQMIEDLQAATDEATQAKDAANQKAEEMKVVVAKIEDDLAKIKANANAVASDLKEVAADLAAQEKAEDALNQEAERIGSVIYQLQQKLAAENAARKAGGGWTWPVPGNTTITSAFGWRIHPVYHYKKFHSGIDISAPLGTKVVAARSGTVLLVSAPVQGRNYGGWGYGNYIVIDHGDGKASLYGHLKQTKVSVGDEVNAGDLIGLVGSTGTSTGPHLHFEVRVNGTTVNPRDYVG